jgi:hypothetical protein
MEYIQFPYFCSLRYPAATSVFDNGHFAEMGGRYIDGDPCQGQCKCYEALTMITIDVLASTSQDEAIL